MFKDRLNSLGAEITSSTTFRNYLNWLDTFYGEVSDKTDLSQNGVVGRTSQDSTTGKNILPQDKYIASRTINGITYTNNGDGTFDLNGTATANTSLRIIDVGIFNLESGQRYYLYSSVAYNSTTFNMSIVTTESRTQKFLIANGNYTPSTTPTSSRLQFYIASGDTVNVQNVKLMLVKGADDTSYEPYTNGASPNPDYPQPINNLSGDIAYKVSGKNLFDKSNITTGKTFSNTGETINLTNSFIQEIYIPVSIETDYTMSTTNDYSSETDYRLVICEYDSNKNFIKRNLGGSAVGNKYTITTSSTTKYVRLCASTITLDELQFERGQATSYEPYISQTFNIPLEDIELCKIDTYEDKIYSSDGRFYLEKNCGSNIFDNDTNVYAVNNTASGASNISLNGTYNILKSILNANIKNDTMYCSIAKYEYNSTIKDNMSAQTNLNDNTMCMRQGTNDRIYFKNSVFTGKTGTEIKELIEGEKLYYVSITPTTTEITQENYPSLYNALKQIQDYLTAYKINKEFILGYSSPEIEY